MEINLLLEPKSRLSIGATFSIPDSRMFDKLFPGGLIMNDAFKRAWLTGMAISTESVAYPHLPLCSGSIGRVVPSEEKYFLKGITQVQECFARNPSLLRRVWDDKVQVHVAFVTSDWEFLYARAYMTNDGPALEILDRDTAYCMEHQNDHIVVLQEKIELQPA